jgi:predicted transcriptional regulator
MAGTVKSVKEEALEMLQRLPEDCTWEDIKYRIYLQERIAEGIADVAAGRVLTQSEVEQEVAGWLKSSGRVPR